MRIFRFSFFENHMGGGIVYQVALLKAIQKSGGQTHLARKIGVSRKRINNWLNHGIRIPYQYAILIEEATDGKVKRHDLAPHALSSNCDLLSLQENERQDGGPSLRLDHEKFKQDLKKEIKAIMQLLRQLYKKIGL